MPPEKHLPRPFFVHLWRPLRRAQLLAAGADPNLRDTKGIPVLHRAVSQDDVPLVRALLKAGAAVRARAPRAPADLYSDRQAWQVAKSEEMFCLLLAAGSPMECEDAHEHRSWSPAFMCARHGWPRALGQILDVLPDAWEATYLADVAHLGTSILTPSIVALVVARGADPNAPDIYGVPALHSATWTNNLAAVEALLRLGADPQARTSHGLTVLEFVQTRNRNAAPTPDSAGFKNQSIALVQSVLLETVLQNGGHAPATETTRRHRL